MKNRQLTKRYFCDCGKPLIIAHIDEHTGDVTLHPCRDCSYRIPARDPGCDAAIREPKNEV